jgi:hypothetical protein
LRSTTEEDDEDEVLDEVDVDVDMIEMRLNDRRMRREKREGRLNE